jgi:hypothetical protein
MLEINRFTSSLNYVIDVIYRERKRQYQHNSNVEKESVTLLRDNDKSPVHVISSFIFILPLICK